MSNRKSAARQSSDVKYSDRGYAFSERGSTRDAGGIVGFFTHTTRPPLATIPEGVLIFNTTLNRLELSDPKNDQWIAYSGTAVSGSGNEIILGVPTDGTYADGAVALNPNGTIADAVDSLNEFLVGSTLSGTAPNQMFRWNGSAVVPTSSLRSDGSGLGIAGQLSVSGGFVTSSGLAPANSGSVTGSSGEFRWDNNFLYVKTSLGWARTALN